MKKVISIILSLLICVSLFSVAPITSYALDIGAQYFFGNHTRNPMETENSQGFTPVMTPTATNLGDTLNPEDLLVPPKQLELEENATRWGLQGQVWNGAAQWQNYTGIRSDGRINVDKCAAGVRFDVPQKGTYEIKVDFFNNSPINGHYHYVFLKSGETIKTIYSFDTNTITETADHNITKGEMVQTYQIYLSKGDVLYFVIDSKGQGASGVYKNLEVSINIIAQFSYGNHTRNPMETENSQGFTPVMTPIATTPEGSLDPDDLLVPPKQTELEENATRWGLKGEVWNGAARWQNYTGIRSDGRINVDKCAAGVRFDVPTDGMYAIRADFFNNSPANGHYHYIFFKSSDLERVLYAFDTNTITQTDDHNITKGSMAQTFELYLTQGDTLYFVIDSKGQGSSGVYKNLEVDISVITQYSYGNHSQNPMTTENSQGFTPVMTPTATTPEGSLNPDDLLVPPKQTELEENATRWGLQGQSWNGAAQWQNYTGIRSDGRINVDKCAAGVRFQAPKTGTYTIVADFYNNSPANGHYHYIFLKSGDIERTLYSFDTNTITETTDHNITKGNMARTFELYLIQGDTLYFVIDSKGQGASGVYKNLDVVINVSPQYSYGNHDQNQLTTENSQGFTPVMTPTATTPEGSLDPDDLLVPPKQTELEENATRWGLQGQAWNGAAQWQNYTGIRSDGRINVDKCSAGVRFDVEESGIYIIKADFFNNSPVNGHYHYIFLKSGKIEKTLYSFDTNTITETQDHNIAKGSMQQKYALYLAEGDVLYFVIDSKGQGAGGVYKNLEITINMLTEPINQDNVRVFEVPDEFPQYEVKYEVKVDGNPMGIYSDRNGWNESVNFGQFELRKGHTAEISITPSFEFSTYKILPDNLSIQSTRVGNTITYYTSDTTAKLSFVFDDDYKGSTLHLFTNPIDDNAPVKSSDNVIYYGPGYHKLYETTAKRLNLQSGYTIYLAGGAVLEGCAVGNNIQDVIITGSGMMLSYHPTDSEWPADKHGRCITLNNCQNVVVENIMSHVHRIKDWTTVVKESSNIVFNNYKVVSPQWASTDAMDIVNSSDVMVKNSFLRATDDTITLKGMADSPANGLPVENITVENTQLWSEANSSMVVGEEARAAYYKNIRFSNIDVLFSYDDKYYHGELDERAVMSIVLLNGTYVEDIIWENIRVNECERLVCLKFAEVFYNGANVGDQTAPGYIKNVTIKNVISNSTSNSAVANQILIQGWDENKTISNVTFDNVLIGNQRLVSLNAENFVMNNFVSNITVQ